MQKQLVCIIVLVLLCGFACSKKQNWNCECGPGGTSTTTYTTTISNATKSNATDLCNKAASNNLSAGSYVCTVSPM